MLYLQDVAGDREVAVAVHGCGGPRLGRKGCAARWEVRRDEAGGAELEREGINSCDSWNSNSGPGQRYGTHGCGWCTSLRSLA
ncbi:hypothetical protein NKH18_20115 [Streptomyces sp. M10(2022)]